MNELFGNLFFKLYLIIFVRTRYQDITVALTQHEDKSNGMLGVHPGGMRDLQRLTCWWLPGHMQAYTGHMRAHARVTRTPEAVLRYHWYLVNKMYCLKQWIYPSQGVLCHKY